MPHEWLETKRYSDGHIFGDVIRYIQSQLNKDYWELEKEKLQKISEIIIKNTFLLEFRNKEFASTFKS